MKKTKMNKLILISILLIFNFYFANSQYQIGQDIDGEAVWDQFGSTTSISADGTRVAIGSSRNAGNGIFYGHVRIYDFDGADWQQLGNDIEGVINYNGVGHRVSISADGNRVALSTKNSMNTPTQLSNHSEVLIFDYNGTDWVQLGQNIRGNSISDLFGNAISLSEDGTRLAIGADKRSTGASGLPYVQVYEYQTNAWVQVGQDIEGALDSALGSSVSLSFNGNRLAVGIPHQNLAHVYEFNGTLWTRLGQDLFGENSTDLFGSVLHLSDDGNTMAVGAHVNDGNGNNTGHVRVFEYSEATWSQIGGDIDGESPLDTSGTSISLSSDGATIAIGAYRNDGNGDLAGHTRIYAFDNNNWQQLYTDIDGESAEDESGFSVSLSANAKIVAIGARNNDDNGNNSGHVRVYSLVNTLSINDYEVKNDITLYPIPVSDIVNIKISNGAIEKVAVYDLSGKHLKDFSGKQINIENLRSGIYLLKIFTQTSVINSKIIKN